MEITNKIIKIINERIKKEICYNTIYKLSDDAILNKCKDSQSVNKKLIEFKKILETHIDDKNIINKIIDDNNLLKLIIPPGTKATIKGNIFNKIIKDNIINLKLDPTHFDVCFEKQHTLHNMDEIPDWYIFEKSSNKIILGMNQLDLWSGGQQINRGYKYIKDNKYNNKNSKLLCVVCNEILFKSTNNKSFKLFEIGFENDTLCYLNNLKNIINSYFNIKL